MAAYAPVAGRMRAEDDTAVALRRGVLTEALQALSPPHREILSETILRDRTVNQAAEALGIPVGTVKSRVYYALRALQVIAADPAAGSRP